jgi:hypothetical protein
MEGCHNVSVAKLKGTASGFRQDGARRCGPLAVRYEQRYPKARVAVGVPGATLPGKARRPLKMYDSFFGVTAVEFKPSSKKVAGRLLAVR